jgi:hypothetical protein
MRLTVIFEDRTIGIDGLFYQFETIEADPNYTAIQWYEDHGTIEVNAGDRIWLDSIEILKPFINQWAERHSSPPPEFPAQEGPKVIE